MNAAGAKKAFVLRDCGTLLRTICNERKTHLELLKIPIRNFETNLERFFMTSEETLKNVLAPSWGPAWCITSSGAVVVLVRRPLRGRLTSDPPQPLFERTWRNTGSGEQAKAPRGKKMKRVHRSVRISSGPMLEHL